MKSEILVPRNLEGRKEKLHRDLIRLLGQEVIEGDLIVDRSFESIPLEAIKVKEVKGNIVLWFYTNIPSWLKDVKISGDLDCHRCDLDSIENRPEHIGGELILCYHNWKKLNI